MEIARKNNNLKKNYGEELGIRITCQRCGKQTFRKKISIDQFEPVPKGWKVNDCFYHQGWWCPDCIRNYTI